MFVFVFVSGFLSRTLTTHRTAGEGRGTFFYSTLPLPPAHEHSAIYVQLCTRDDYHIFLIVTLVFTRLLLDKIYHLIELLFGWLMMWCWFKFVCLLIWAKVLLQLFDMWETGRLELSSTITFVFSQSSCFKALYKRSNDQLLFQGTHWKASYMKKK